ncbi:MAG: VanZ family protein [Lentisphaeria bacterium]|nr:VanZ family protein [Candidatus Neomarinimicrobiota bacterium]MCF7842253.1 VanZ family protein [Lentisphaeria bacterium]
MRRTIWTFWLPPFLYTLLIIFASTLPNRVVSEYTFELSDKILHSVHFMLYGITLIWGFLGTQALEEGFKNAYLKAIGVGMVVACLDEFYQSFIPSRTSSVWDILADSVGILLAGITFYYLMKIPVVKRIRRYVEAT